MPSNPSTVRSGCTSMRPPWPTAIPAWEMAELGWIPPAHTTVRVMIWRPSESVARSAAMSLDLEPELEVDAPAWRAFGRVGLGAVGERCEHDGPGSTRWTRAALTSRSW